MLETLGFGKVSTFQTDIEVEGKTVNITVTESYIQTNNFALVEGEKGEIVKPITFFLDRNTGKINLSQSNIESVEAAVSSTSFITKLAVAIDGLVTKVKSL